MGLRRMMGPSLETGAVFDSATARRSRRSAFTILVCGQVCGARRKHIEKLRYIHRKRVKRGLAEKAGAAFVLTFSERLARYE